MKFHEAEAEAEHFCAVSRNSSVTGSVESDDCVVGTCGGSGYAATRMCE